MADQGIPQPLAPPTPFIGAVPLPAQQYPVANTNPGSASSGGLVNVAGQIREAHMQDQNMQNQRAQMSRADTEFKEQQRAAQAKGDVGTPDQPVAPPSTGDGHADFMATLMHGLHAIGTGVQRVFGATPPAGIPAPAAPSPQVAAPQAITAQEGGGPVPQPTYLDAVKDRVSELASRAAAAASNAVGAHHVGTGAAEQAASTIESGTHRAMDVADEMSKMKGGPITDRAPPLRFMQGPTVGNAERPAQILAFENGGAVPAYGVVSGSVQGLPGFEGGGAIPAPGPDGATAQAAPTASPVAQAQVTSQQARAEMTKAIVDAHTLLDGHTLDDNDTPKNASGIAAPPPAAGPAPAAQGAPAPAAPQGAPAPAPGSAGGGAPAAPVDPKLAASAAAAQNAGSPENVAQIKSGDAGPSDSERPHSITPDQWAAFEQRKEYAVKMAAYAGQDPGQVRMAMDANRNAWVQGGVLKYLAAANAASLNGDTAGVEKALKNAYYYLPDGQELKTDKKGPDGQLQYQDPINPWVDGKQLAAGKLIPVDPGTPGAQANMIPVDTRHIQMLGTAMLDPMAVQNSINSVLQAQSQIKLRQQQGQAALTTSQGNLAKGQGIFESGEAHLGRVSAQNWRDLATGDAERMRAQAVANHLSNFQRTNKVDQGLLKGAQDSASAFNDLAQGQRVTDQSTTGADGLPNPNYGKPTRDPNRIPPELKGATPGDVMDGAAMAGKIHMGSGGAIAPPEAARLAALYTQMKRMQSGAGKDGKHAGVMTDHASGMTYVWNPKTKTWEHFQLPVTGANGTAPATMGVSDSDLDPVAQQELARNSGSGGAEGSTQGMDTPDMEDQKFPPES